MEPDACEFTTTDQDLLILNAVWQVDATIEFRGQQVCSLIISIVHHHSYITFGRSSSPSPLASPRFGGLPELPFGPTTHTTTSRVVRNLYESRFHCITKVNCQDPKRILLFFYH
jgi:hypothetical protein